MTSQSSTSIPPPVSTISSSVLTFSLTGMQSHSADYSALDARYGKAAQENTGDENGKSRGGKGDKNAPLVLVTPDGSLMEKPKRLRTAYNLFFKHHRELLLESLPIRRRKPRNSHGKIGFTSLAQTIAARWKTISDEEKAYFQELADQDRARYKREMKVWKELEKAHELNSVLSRNMLPTTIMPLQPSVTSNSEDLEPFPICHSQQDCHAQPLSSSAALDNVAQPDCFGSMHGKFDFSDYVPGQANNNMRRLADCLGPECVSAFIKAFR